MSNRLRAGDADRDRAARLLGVHFAAGRLTPDEFCDRLTAALGAVSFADLDEIVADLPGGPAMVRPQVSALERNYRRLLALYPAQYRRVHEDEMLAVLLTGAPDGKVRPGLREAADLLGACLRIWCQSLNRRGWRGIAVLTAAGAVTGILGGIAVAAATPPAPASAALIAVPSNRVAAIQGDTALDDIFILDSTDSLTLAARAIGPGMSWKNLHSRVRAVPVNANVIQVTVSAPTGTQAEIAANAVATGWIAYTRVYAPGLDPVLLQRATTAYRPSVLPRIIDGSGIGALCGGVLGVLIAIGVSRPGRRFRMT